MIWYEPVETFCCTQERRFLGYFSGEGGGLRLIRQEIWSLNFWNVFNLISLSLSTYIYIYIYIFIYLFIFVYMYTISKIINSVVCICYCLRCRCLCYVMFCRRQLLHFNVEGLYGCNCVGQTDPPMSVSFSSSQYRPVFPTQSAVYDNSDNVFQFSTSVPPYHRQ